MLQIYGGRESAALAVPVCEHLVTWSAAVECKHGGQNHFVAPIALVAGHGSNTLQARGRSTLHFYRVWFSMVMMQGTVMACLSPHGSCPTATRDVCPVLKPNICKQSSLSSVLSRGEREFPFPKILNEFFISIPFPKRWKCNFTTFYC